MTDDKDFKQLVRDEARRTGRRYTDVRADLRPPGAIEPVDPMPLGDVAARFAAIVDVMETWVYGKTDVVRLVATALLVPGNVLLRGAPGNGMTALGQAVAAAIGGHLVSIDGRTGLDPAEASRWRSDDVVVVSHLDGLDPAAQVAVVEGGKRPAIVLAKRHPIADRMPHPPDDDTRERFLFGAELDYADVDTELRIVSEIRDRTGGGARDAVVSVDDLGQMRAAAAAVNVPDEVRRFAVDAVAGTRRDDALLLGASGVATIGLVAGAAAVAAAAGRDTATVADARTALPAVLAHRVVWRPDVVPDLAQLVERLTTAATRQ